MKRENMLKRLKKRLGANGPGLTVAVVAMLVALTGGAFAASGALTKTQKKEVKAIVKKEAKTIPGAPGAQGLAGAKGDKGDKGDRGEKGEGGPSGKSVVIGNTPTTCEALGGKTIEVEGAPATRKDICNGKEGSPWTDGGTLPPGATETGVWTLNGTSADTKGIQVPISFPIKFNGELLPGQVHYATEGSFGQSCKGEPYRPEADPGQLCVYFAGTGIEGTSFKAICPAGYDIAATCFGANEPGATPAGAVLVFATPGAGEVASGSGTFAVQAKAAGP